MQISMEDQRGAKPNSRQIGNIYWKAGKEDCNIVDQHAQQEDG